MAKVPDSLIDAIIHYESSGNPDAMSNKDAVGLMQLLPGTARDLGVTDRFDPEQNRRGGTKYINQLVDKYGDVNKALIAYNWGPGNVDRLGVDKAPASSKEYAANIINRAGINKKAAMPSIDDFLDEGQPAAKKSSSEDFLGGEITPKPSAQAVSPARTAQAVRGRQLTPQAQALEDLVAQSKSGGLSGLAKGVGESGLSFLTGLGATAAGGLAGAGRTAAALLSGEGLDRAAELGANTVRNVQEAATYQPRSPQGQAITSALGEVANIPNVAGRNIGEEVGTQIVGPRTGLALGSALEAAPALVPSALALRNTAKTALARPAASDAAVSSRGSKLLQKAMENLSPEEIAQARQLVQQAGEQGISLTGPEAFKIAPALHDLVTNVDKSNNIITQFVKRRPEEAKAAIRQKLEQVGEDVSLQQAANQAEEAAGDVITNAQKFRTEAASPDYKAQRAMDENTLDLLDEIKVNQDKIDAGTKWKNDAIQQAGRWYAFSNEMGLNANKVADQLREWAGGSALKDGDAATVAQWKREVLKDHPEARFTKEDGEGSTYGERGDWTAHTGPDMQSDVVGTYSPNGDFASVFSKSGEERNYITKTGGGARPPEVQGDVQEFMQRRAEGQSATTDAVNEARRRQDFIDQWQGELVQKADTLAKRNMPRIQDRMENYVASLDRSIRLANPNTTEGQILSQFRNELAPNGQPLWLPSQLESVLKANRDKLDLGLNPSAVERTTAGVLKDKISSLDGLVQEISPAIKQGREIYKQLSQEFVDPLMKSAVGRVAGRGADAAKEATVSRVLAELQGKSAHPDRIRMLADNLTEADPKAFPNIVRAYLEDKFNTAGAEKLGKTDRLTGAKFAEAIAATDRDRQNIATMIEKSAEAQGKSPEAARQAAQGFSEMLGVLKSTGRLPKIGVQGIEEGSLFEQAVQAAPHLKSYGAGKALVSAIQEIINRRAYRDLAKIFTDPNSVDKMVELTNSRSSKPERRKEIVADILRNAAPAAASPALQADQEQEP